MSGRPYCARSGNVDANDFSTIEKPARTANREKAVKVLAVLTLAPEAQFEKVRAELPNELKCSWELYASGVLRGVYATADPRKVVFIVEAADAEGAKHILAALPMVAAGMFNTEFVELRPFVNWSMLFAH
jgi:uncharacterized protein YciI